MKRFRFYFTHAFMAVLMVAALSCSKEDDADPEGTITAYMRDGNNGATEITPS